MRRQIMRRRTISGLLVACGLLLGACGIPTSNQADVVPSHDVPFHLLSPTVPTSTTTTLFAAPYVSELIYLVKSSALVGVRREVVVPAPLNTVIDALLAGPTSSETANGLTTALPPSVRIVSTVIVAGVATINMNAAFGQISGSAETLAVGQLVLTATSQPDVTAVSFAINGLAIAVPTADGASTKVPVTASQYAALLAGPSAK